MTNTIYSGETYTAQEIEKEILASEMDEIIEAQCDLWRKYGTYG